MFSVIVAKKNDNVELECRTQGDPSPSVRWYKDSAPVDLTNARFLVTGEIFIVFSQILTIGCRIEILTLSKLHCAFIYGLVY